MSKVTLRVLVFVAVVTTALGQNLFASAVAVGPSACQPSLVHFSTIQAAVNAVPINATILVCPGTYPEQVTINAPLTLKGITDGTGNAAVVTAPSGGMKVNTTRVSQILTPGRGLAAQILVTATTGVNISNLTVDGTGNGIGDPTCSNPDPLLAGVYFRVASGMIKNVATRSQVISPAGCDDRGFGIMVETGGTSASPVPASVAITGTTVRSYESVGIAADDFGVTVTLKGNTIYCARPASTLLGIQMVGATGTVAKNSVTENGLPASTDILADASHAVVISGNNLAAAGNGIVVASDDSINGDADSSQVTSNTVVEAQDLTSLQGAVSICSNNSLVQRNTINSSVVSAIFVDTCGNTVFTSNNNTIQGNTINEACAGVMLNTTTGDSVSANQFYNVNQTLLNGSSCSPPLPTAPTRPAGWRATLR
jgi:hypothetical protein